MQTRTAMIAGATGLIGFECLKRLLDDPLYSKVISVGRRKVAGEHPKLDQCIVDFGLLETESILPPVDDVFCCLGTTIAKAKTKTAFREVDHNYVIHLARTALKTGAKRFLVVSSMGASSGSWVFYNRVKGDMERDLSTLNFEQISIFRPSMLLGDRKENRPGEALGKKVMHRLSFIFRGPLLKYRPIEASVVAKVMNVVAVEQTGKVEIIESDKMQSIYDSLS